MWDGSDKKNEMKLEVLSRSSNESFARVAVAAFIAQMDPTVEEVSDIKTAVSEAVTNCIVHAYPGTIGRIYITVKLIRENRVVIQIRDNGCGIADVAQAMTPLYTSAGDERAGLGFAVMQNFMDALRVRSKPGHGTSVVMVKKLSRRSVITGAAGTTGGNTENVVHLWRREEK